MAETKRKTPVVPKTTIKVTPTETFFEVSVPGAEAWWDDSFRFSITTDGSVTINDNEFSTKKQAAQALQAMADFLKK